MRALRESSFLGCLIEFMISDLLHLLWGGIRDKSVAST